MLLEMNNVSAAYGDLQVLFDVSLNIGEGECVALVGSNGAGKTSLLRVISGFLPVKSGTVTYNGKDLLSSQPYERVDLGIAHIPQGRGVLGQSTVMDNLILGSYHKNVKARRAESIEKAFETFPILKERQNQLAGSLSGGEQQMLAIARALIMEPKLLMMDEPSLGLAPIIVDEVFDAIERTLSTGMSILLIEQNLTAALSIAERGYVIETGSVFIEGSSDELQNNDTVKKSYLGI